MATSNASALTGHEILALSFDVGLSSRRATPFEQLDWKFSTKVISPPDGRNLTPALTRKADSTRTSGHVGFVPQNDRSPTLASIQASTSTANSKNEASILSRAKSPTLCKRPSLCRNGGACRIKHLQPSATAQLVKSFILTVVHHRHFLKHLVEN